jgi:hypothetical protein
LVSDIGANPWTLEDGSQLHCVVRRIDGVAAHERGYSSITSIAISGQLDFMGVAVFIEVEQFGRQRLAARVPLAFVRIDVNLQLP